MKNLLKEFSRERAYEAGVEVSKLKDELRILVAAGCEEYGMSVAIVTAILGAKQVEMRYWSAVADGEAPT